MKFTRRCLTHRVDFKAPVIWDNGVLDLCRHMVSLGHNELTHWGRVTHICVSKLASIVSDNGLSPGRRQAIIWTNTGILLIGPLGTNFSDILIDILSFSFKKMRLKVSSVKWRPFCFGHNVLNKGQWITIMFVCIMCLFAPFMVHCGFNSFSHSAAYMRHWTGSVLVQIMACRLFGAKPLSKPMLGCCQLDP